MMILTILIWSWLGLALASVVLGVNIGITYTYIRYHKGQKSLAIVLVPFIYITSIALIVITLITIHKFGGFP